MLQVFCCIATQATFVFTCLLWKIGCYQNVLRDSGYLNYNKVLWNDHKRLHPQDTDLKPAYWSAWFFPPVFRQAGLLTNQTHCSTEESSLDWPNSVYVTVNLAARGGTCQKTVEKMNDVNSDVILYKELTLLAKIYAILIFIN